MLSPQTSEMLLSGCGPDLKNGVLKSPPLQESEHLSATNDAPVPYLSEENAVMG